MKLTKSLIICVAFLFAVVVGGGVALTYSAFTGLSPAVNETAQKVSEQKKLPTSPTHFETAGSDTDCSFPDFDHNAEPKEGFVTDWKPWGKRLKVPVSSHGAQFIDPVPHCFAPSNEGAVLAAASWFLTATSGEKTSAVYEQMVFKDELGLEAIEGIKSTPSELEPVFELKGWNFQRIADDHVVVYIAASRVDAPNRLLQIGVEMKYANGDWKYVFTKNTASRISELFSLESGGFKRW